MVTGRLHEVTFDHTTPQPILNVNAGGSVRCVGITRYLRFKPIHASESYNMSVGKAPPQAASTHEN
ncbi:MAG: hypothetical protein CMH58_08615 [Myxococcales bacterium]|nr:hypothetical protein [Myxococcales bacterium]